MAEEGEVDLVVPCHAVWPGQRKVIA
jgi:hypothetical protein